MSLISLVLKCTKLKIIFRPVRKDQEDMSPLGTTRWQLTSPTPRPHMTTPLQVSYTPSQHVTTITRVTVPADTCDRGSRFCIIV